MKNLFSLTLSKELTEGERKIQTNKRSLKTISFETPLGSMIAVGDEEILYLLEFSDYPELTEDLNHHQYTQSSITQGNTNALQSIQEELEAYFSGTLKVFKTPFHSTGTPFQKEAWRALLSIPYGETRSYIEQSKLLRRPSAYRAVGNANAANRLAIIIPCHRVINHNGKLGGYAGNLDRKKWLLEHEYKNKMN